MVRRTTNLLEIAPPVAPKYGILSPAVTVVREGTEDWIAGFTYETTDASVNVNISTIFGSTTEDEYTAIDGDPASKTGRFYYPFDIRASVRASTMGTNIDALQETADIALEVVTQKAIEIEFWKGTAAKALESANDNRYLSHVDATNVGPTAGTPVKVRYGQALLEQALGNSNLGSQGVIHAPLLIASVLQASEQDGALTTNLGNKIVAGAGYSNTGPNGAVAPVGSAWMYATGPVTVRLGATPTVTTETLSQAVDIGNNTVEFYVDRPAAVTWSTSNLYAVLVDLSLDYT